MVVVAYSVQYVNVWLSQFQLTWEYRATIHLSQYFLCYCGFFYLLSSTKLNHACVRLRELVMLNDECESEWLLSMFVSVSALWPTVHGIGYTVSKAHSCYRVLWAETKQSKLQYLIDIKLDLIGACVALLHKSHRLWLTKRCNRSSISTFLDINTVTHCILCGFLLIPQGFKLICSERNTQRCHSC